MKFLKIAVVVLAVLVAVVGLVLWDGVDATGLGNTALDQLGVESDMDARIEGARFSLRDGLSLQGLYATSSTEAGEMEGYVESLHLDVSLLPLLSGEVEIHSLTLESPWLAVVLREDAWQDDGQAPGDTAPSEVPAPADVAPVRIASLELRDAVLGVNVEGQPKTVVLLEQLDAQLRDVSLNPASVPLVLGTTGSGVVTIGAAVVGSLRIDHATGRASLANGRIEMSEIVATAPAGNLEVPRLSVDMTAVPSTFEAEMHADSVDLGLLAGYPDVQPFGDTALTATLSGSTGGELTGDGTLRLAAGGMPQSESLSSLDSLLGTSLTSARYEEAIIEATPIPGGIRIQPFELFSPAVRLRGLGTLTGGQNLDLRLSVGVPRSAVKSISFSGLVLDGLTDAEGWVNFPVHVGGTVLEPSYEVDTAAMKSNAASRARRSALEEAQRRIGRVIGGSICCGR